MKPFCNFNALCLLRAGVLFFSSGISNCYFIRQGCTMKALLTGCRNGKIAGVGKTLRVNA